MGVLVGVCELGRFGQKTGAGWFRYEAGSRTPLPDPVVDNLILEISKENGITRREVTDTEILERCLYPLVNEGAKILEEGLALRAGDIDVIIDFFRWHPALIFDSVPPFDNRKCEATTLARCRLAGGNAVDSHHEVGRLCPPQAHRRRDPAHVPGRACGVGVLSRRRGHRIVPCHPRPRPADRDSAARTAPAGDPPAQRMPRPVDRVSLLDRVAAILDGADVRYAVIGASAMAAHGVARSTHDIDLLTLADQSLDTKLWAPLADAGVAVSVTRGDGADPLAGVVRFEETGKRPVDLVVGRHWWQVRMLERAEPAVVHGSRVPTVQARDVIALKLFAGGAQDAWDVVQLLTGPDRDALIAEVSSDIVDLPAHCHDLWERILTEDSA